jgi:hypothetical protein
MSVFSPILLQKSFWRAKKISQERRLLLPLSRYPTVLQRLWRGYAAVVGRIIIVAVSTGDRGGSAIVTLPVVSTRGGGTDRNGADRSGTNAHRHARAVNATSVDAAAIGATSVDATTNASCANSTRAVASSAEATCAGATTAKCGRLV